MKKLFKLSMLFVLLAVVLAAFAMPALAQEATPETPVVVTEPPDVVVVAPGGDLPDWLTIVALLGLGGALLFVVLRGNPTTRDADIQAQLLKFQQDRAAIEALERRVQQNAIMQQVLTLVVAGGRPVASMLPGNADTTLIDVLDDILQPGNPLAEQIADAAARKVLEAQRGEPTS